MRSGSISEDRRKQNIRYLSEAWQKNKLAHAYIIEGGKESGKESFADDMAAALLCEQTRRTAADPGTSGFLLDPCGRCPSCIRARSGNHPDIIHVEHEKERVLSVREVREQIVGDIAIKPYYGPYKIYIVRDAQLMNESAQNALLKTIEEPEEYGILFLLTDNADVFLPTILSRCIKIRMADPARAQIAEKLLSEDGDKVLQLLRDLPGMSALQIDQAAKEWENEDRQQILSILQLYFRDVLVFKSTGSYERLYFGNAGEQISRTAADASYEGIQQILNALEETGRRLTASVKAEAAFEALLLQIRRCIV